ncbi:MAG TPA: GDSL-type esterase/lipase family protein [Caulobacteraceae bacterium]|nr:GDSL-type esterase/lipase family protein [Caulobacteraceae bacterium]
MKALLSLALAVALSSAASADQAQVCRTALCGGDSLGPFFDKLDAGRQHGAHPLNIVVIGDSHSAGDNISGAWRETLQEHYGRGGRGVMAAGIPFEGFKPRGVTASMSPGWTTQSIFDPVFRNLQAHALFGISGFRQTAERAGSKMTLTADTPPFAFNRLVICAVNGPDAGAYDVTLGAVTTHVDLHADETHVACVTVQSPDHESLAELDVAAGPVTLTSWGSFRDDGGVTVSNLGVVGTQIRNFAETDDDADAAELAAYEPGLIVVEFGTNDGFVERFEPESYEQMLRSQIRRLKRLTRDVPILLLGAPDAATDRRDIVANAYTTEPPPAPGIWYPPPALAAVRQIQRRVAAEMGVAFWDWSYRMGGPYTADKWANADPPLMRKDRVHYTVAGGERIAGLLEADLEAAKAAYILSDR